MRRSLIIPNDQNGKEEIDFSVSSERSGGHGAKHKAQKFCQKTWGILPEFTFRIVASKYFNITDVLERKFLASFAGKFDLLRAKKTSTTAHWDKRRSFLHLLPRTLDERCKIANYVEPMIGCRLILAKILREWNKNHRKVLDQGRFYPRTQRKWSKALLVLNDEPTKI